MVPFNPERRRMCSFAWVPDEGEGEGEEGTEDEVKTGEGEEGGCEGGHYRMYVKGADKDVLALCTSRQGPLAGHLHSPNSPNPCQFAQSISIHPIHINSPQSSRSPHLQLFKTESRRQPGRNSIPHTCITGRGKTQ